MKIIPILLFCCFFTAMAFAQEEPVKSDPSVRITISPNPVPGNYFIVENDSCSYEHFDRMVIYNSNGFVMQNKQLQMFRGTTRQQVDISGYNPGNYFVRIVDVNNPSFSYATQLVVK